MGKIAASADWVWKILTLSGVPNEVIITFVDPTKLSKDAKFRSVDYIRMF